MTRSTINTRARSRRCRRPARWRVRHGDCLEVLPRLAADSVDAIVTDPPYGLGFMGKDWDSPGGVGAHPMRRRVEMNTVNTGVTRQGARQRSGIGFTRSQASDAHGYQAWSESWAREALRVLKPGGYLLAFGGTRTFHRLCSALEDAGFEIRDCLCWLYGSGFPKSLDVSKAIDKAEGAKREVIGTYIGATNIARQADSGKFARYEPGAKFHPADRQVAITRPATPEAREWNGWGTALKPAWEPIILARKPLNGTVAQNVRRYRTGALNIDSCRIGFRDHADEHASKAKNRHGDFRSRARENRVYAPDKRSRGQQGNYDPSGRWPANVTLSHTKECQRLGQTRVRSNGHHPAHRGKGALGTAAGHQGQSGLHKCSRAAEHSERWECSADCPVRMLDEHSGIVGNGWREDYGQRYAAEGRQYHGGRLGGGGYRRGSTYTDTGGASRFFYCAKASRAERDTGLDRFDQATTNDGRRTPIDNPYQRGATVRRNVHPTVKPIELMRWLVRLTTPPGGTVLDPFTGSGSTGIAAVIEGARFLGIERDAEYATIAKARIKHWAPRPPQATAAQAARKAA